MKKYMMLLFALIILFGFYGCSKQKEVLPPNNDIETQKKAGNSDQKEADSSKNDYGKLAQELSIQMEQDDFTQTCELFSGDVKAVLDKAGMEDAWNQTVASIGSYIQYVDTNIQETKEATIVISTLEYEKSGLAIKYTFNSAGEIDAIWLNYCTIPSNTEDFKEVPIEIGEYKLDGILTLPNNAEEPPVAILIQGSGQSDMSETIGANKPFENLAQELAKQGIATIRYNKRYYQHPEYADESITISDEVLDDASAAVEFARKCESVDATRIIIIGHSLGGMVAPIICEENPTVAGMISLAGSPRNLADIIYDQNEDAIAGMDLSDDIKSQQLAKVKTEVEKIKALTAEDTDTYFNCNAKYWYSLNQLNSGEVAKFLEIPMLFLQGSADFQVNIDKDFTEWKEILKNKLNCTFKEYNNLNHLFMNSNGKSDITEYDVAGKVDGTVIMDIADWINGIGQ